MSDDNRRRFGRTYIGTSRTKDGGVDIAVNVVITGPKDGAAACMRDLSAALAKVPRLAACDVSPVVEMADLSLETLEAAAMDWEGTDARDPRE